MLELLETYWVADRLTPVLALLVVVGIFAAVRHGERLRPLKESPDDQ